MVGKLWLNLGDDYAYDIRRARAVAEGVATADDGATVQPVDVPKDTSKEKPDGADQG